MLLVLVSLPGPVAWAQAGLSPAREVKARRAELSSGAVPEVRVAPGYLTTLEFDSPLDRDALTVEGRESRFALLETNTRTLVLRPAVELASGERLLVTVGFADGLVPAKAVLALVAHPTEVDGQVQVVRQPLSSEALQARLEAALARCEAGGLAKVVLSGAVDDQGVTVELLEGRCHWRGLQGIPLQSPMVYRSWKSFVVIIPLHLPAGGTPWTPGEARLLDAEGRVVQRMPVWLDVVRLTPGGTGSLAVEMDLRPEDAGRFFVLEVREKDGERGVVIERVRL
ncbi:DUF2381 family protein [Hyalangium rubrum]|uniref:DUF2381 family protein n=1 Tax=Hyalangium rubrum TaxID=3103134 RepID=A0ABU5HD70_9BACT|nr:DUF2381 family protein [Hyalangium sp. s54d21]MDY7231407.1 DUF2381 family protein [Hyalangium sp. s54d21]